METITTGTLLLSPWTQPHSRSNLTLRNVTSRTSTHFAPDLRRLKSNRHLHHAALQATIAQTLRAIECAGQLSPA